MQKQLKLLGMLAVLLLVALAATPTSANNGQGEVIAVTGIVPGQDLIVHVLALVNPGQNRSDVAKDVLAGQGARALTSQEFSTISISWDEFDVLNDGNDFVEQSYNPANQPSGVTHTQLTNAQTTWTNVAESSFAFSYGGTTTRCPSLVKECPGRQTFDDNNDVAWVNLKGGNILGVTWTGTNIDEADMALNTSFNWFVNGTDYDVETVFLHEEGHALGLGHSNDITAVMYPSYQVMARSLQDDDKNGVTYKYPAPGAVNQTPSATITSPDDRDTFVSGAMIAFTGTADDAEDGDITVDLVWTSSIDGSIGSGASPSEILSDGTHEITASVMDSGSTAANSSITVTVGALPPPPPPPPGSVTVSSIDYSGTGGRNQNVHLLIDVTLSEAVADAMVSVTVFRNNAPFGTATGATDSNWVAHFKATKAPAGDYRTEVDSITGVNWDGSYPSNGTTWP